MLVFESPSLSRKKEILSYRQEIIRTDRLFDGSAGLGNFRTVEEWLERLHGMEPEHAHRYGYYPTVVYLAFRKNMLCGILNVRLSDDELLRSSAGHIGYHVRPSMRRCGIGSALLSHAVKICAAYGICSPVVCTEENNTASQKTALSCGFVPDGKTVLSSGETICRFVLQNP